MVEQWREEGRVGGGRGKMREEEEHGKGREEGD